MSERKFRIRIEEMPVIGQFLLDSFSRDITEFNGYSPDFTNTYKVNFQNKLNTMDGIVNPKKLLGELKVITNRLYKTIESLRPLLTKIEGYVKRASNLTILKGDFGFKEVRKKISNKDQEGLLENMKVLIQNLDDNKAALQAKGYKAVQHTELVVKRDSIKADNIAQNRKMEEREALVDNNIDTLNELWDIMADVMDAGKRLYKHDNADKLPDYTLTYLKNRIRQEHPRDEE